MERKNMEDILVNENKYELLSQAVKNLASETGYEFCLGCYNYSNDAKYLTITCPLCSENSCSECDAFHQLSLDGNTFQVCDSCNTVIHENFLMKVSVRDNDLIDSLTPEIVESALEYIDDQLQGGEYYQCQTDLPGLFEVGKNTYAVVRISTLADEDTSHYEIVDVIDEINMFISERTEGFAVDLSVLNMGVTGEVILDLEFLSL